MSEIRRGPRRGPGGRMMHITDKPKDFKGTLKKAIAYLGPYKIAILFVVFLSIASTIFTIASPKILGKATTEIFNGIMNKVSGNGMGINFEKILEIILFLILLYLTSAIFSFLQGFIMSGISNKLTLKMRTELDEKIHKLPFSYYDTVATGDVLSRITNDVDTINMNLNQGITQIITAITSLVGILVMMLSISLPMTLVALVSLPVSGIIIALIFSKSQKHFIRQQKYMGSVGGVVEEIYGSHIVVKAFNGEEKALSEFNENNNNLYESAWKANFFSSLMMPLMNFVANLSYVVICILGGYFASRGALSVGDIQAFTQYVRQFNQPINQLSQISNILQQTVAAAERVFTFLEEEEDPADKENALGVALSPSEQNEHNIYIDGKVVFSGVHFGYLKDKEIIHDFNAVVEKGQKVAIVGPTGAGKTTMVKLLMRFYDVTQGAILVDGYNIKDFKREELRTQFGMVLQDTWLYNGTVADNIRYGKLDATQEEVISAAKAAQAHHFIKTLPGGYDMEINEEATNISQGQKQLLTIARAILADPKVLILDEATSSVDTRTEIQIQKAMDNLMKGRTSFIIAHRLSTIKNADLILVMNQGDIIEQGTHLELLNKNGFYANLYNSQFVKISQ